MNWLKTSKNLPDETTELENREQLIQRATTRLRRRLLEEKLQDVMNQLIQFQAHLETVRVETSTTLKTLANIPEEMVYESVYKVNRQMDTLEKRLESHTFELSQFSCSESDASSSSDLMSTTSSYSTGATSVNESFFDKQEKGRRRSRFKSHKKQYQESILGTQPEHQIQDEWNSRVAYIDAEDGDEAAETTFYDLSGKYSCHGSFCGSVYTEDQSPIPSLKYYKRRRHIQIKRKSSNKIDDDMEELASSTSFEDTIDGDSYSQFSLANTYQKQSNVWTVRTLQPPKSSYNRPNVLEEAMKFLDDVEKETDEDDDGFCEDLYLLLQNPDLCCRPYAEIEKTMHELRQQRPIGYTWPFHGVVYKATASTLRWARFLSILSATVAISIMRGPDDLLWDSPVTY
ncbi:hypothetical protein BY458DRAFT_556236 [Sporodiniella umbellata]|nr:hypothetical protein BY458DRAFT_556236 [Sporodiniella umbellata]